jgi:predicted phosphoribosyltransferase
LQRLGNTRSGEGASSADVLADTVAIGEPQLDDVGTLIVVDDILEAGKAAGAAIARLRESGLPEHCRIVLAVPLVVYKSNRNKVR